ncbi:MAG: ABC transporter substrate-binding protein [Burkholderiales bacterium PBB5]|nr:MAG: ABC transporter substrate-binding protein [Burkholderiales bacterium PBB5]
MGQRLGQQVLVDNKPGAGTVIGAGQVAQAAADGYTLLISSNTTFTINPALKSKLPYDPLTSFESLGVMGSSPLVLLANPALPVKDVKGLVALAKAQPGKLSFGSFGNGSTSHFAGEMFKLVAGINIVHVPYKGSAPAMQDLMGGQIQLTFDTNVASIPQIKAGKVKALAVTSLKPSTTLPGVPSIAESGYAGFEMVPWITVVAPRGLPAAVRNSLTRAFADSLADAGTRAELEKVGVDVVPEPPAAYERRVADELPKLRVYVHKAGLTVE